MIVSTRTDKTAGGIRAALEQAMNINPRKRVFFADAEQGGDNLVAGPDAERFDLHFCFLEYDGFSGIQRYAWDTVPGYADRVCNNLAVIMKTKK